MNDIIYYWISKSNDKLFPYIVYNENKQDPMPIIQEKP